MGQLSAIGQTSTGQSTNKTAQGYRSNQSSPADVLIVQVSNSADQEKLDELLHEVHGTVIDTMTIGPNLKLLTIQTEPGTIDKVEMQLAKCKDISSIQRNQLCRTKQ